MTNLKTRTIVILCLALTAMTGFAQPNAQDLIKYRQSAMMFMRWNIGIIKQQVAVNSKNYNQQQVSAAANAIAAVANTDLLSLFAPGTETGEGWKNTRVRAEFFERPHDVQRHLAMLKKEAKKLSRVAEKADIKKINSQFKHLFKACRACHINFRQKT